MPRYVNTDEHFIIGLEKDWTYFKPHITKNCRKNNFESRIWNKLLSYFNICVKEEYPFFPHLDQLRPFQEVLK